MFDVGIKVKSTLVFFVKPSCLNSIKNIDSFGLSCRKYSENNFSIEVTYCDVKD